MGDKLYYLAGLTAFTVAIGLPGASISWLTARVLIDSAGALFGLYLTVMIGLLLIGLAMRLRSPAAESTRRPPA